MPLPLLMIAKAFMSSVGSLLVKWAMKLVAGPAIEKLMLSTAKKYADKSDNKIDDEVIKILEKKQSEDSK